MAAPLAAADRPGTGDHGRRISSLTPDSFVRSDTSSIVPCAPPRRTRRVVHDGLADLPGRGAEVLQVNRDVARRMVAAPGFPATLGPRRRDQWPWPAAAVNTWWLAVCRGDVVGPLRVDLVADALATAGLGVILDVEHDLVARHRIGCSKAYELTARSIGQLAREFDLTETAVREWVRQPTWTPEDATA